MRPPTSTQRDYSAVEISAAEFERAMRGASIRPLPEDSASDEQEDFDNDNEEDEDENTDEESEELEETDNEPTPVVNNIPVVKKSANKQAKEARRIIGAFLPESPAKVLSTYQTTLARLNEDHEKMYQEYEANARRQLESRLAEEKRYSQERAASQMRRRADLEQRIEELKAKGDGADEDFLIEKTIRDLEALPDVASVRATKLGIIITTKNLYSTQKCSTTTDNGDPAVVYDMPRVYMGTYKIYFKASSRGSTSRRKPFIKCIDKGRFTNYHPFFSDTIRNYNQHMCYGTFEDVLTSSLTRGNIVHATIVTLMVLRSLNVTGGYHRNLAEYFARNKSLPVNVKLEEGDNILVAHPLLYAGFGDTRQRDLLTKRNYPARVIQAHDGTDNNGMVRVEYAYCARHDGNEEHDTCFKDVRHAYVFANNELITPCKKRKAVKILSEKELPF